MNLKRSASDVWLSWDILLLWLPLLGMSPLLFLEFSQMWAKPHLQYFPISIAAFGWLVWQEMPKPRSYAEGIRHHISMVLLCLSILVGVAALWLYSPLFGLVSSILAVGAWSFKSLAESSIPRIIGLLAIVVSCIPLPLNYDAILVGELQELASRTCSYALDGLNVPHLLEGNIIQIADHPLFVEEACSGVTSLYSLLSLGIIFAVLNKRSLMVALATLLFIPLLAVTTNLMRLLSIVLALQWWDIDLSHGFVHTVLGLVVFSIGAISLFCLDRTFASLLAPIPDDRSKAAILLSVYNNLVRWPYFYRSLRSASSAKTATVAEDISASEQSTNLTPEVHHDIPNWLKRVSPLFFLLLFIASLSLMVYLGLNSSTVFAEPSISDELAAQFPGEKALPEELGDSWKQIGFRVEKRDRESMYGQRSHFWQYRNSESVLILSLDYPFRAWHPLDHCYSKSGWTIESIEMVENPANQHWPWIEVQMTNGLGLRGFLYYCHFDERGEPYITKEMSSNIVESRANVNALRMLSGSDNLREPITYQFQLFIESADTLTEDEQKKLRDMFLTSREMVRQASLEVVTKVSE